jgi:hypothetical protein
MGNENRSQVDLLEKKVSWIVSGTSTHVDFRTQPRFYVLHWQERLVIFTFSCTNTLISSCFLATDRRKNTLVLVAFHERLPSSNILFATFIYLGKMTILILEQIEYNLSSESQKRSTSNAYAQV